MTIEDYKRIASKTQLKLLELHPLAYAAVMRADPVSPGQAVKIMLSVKPTITPDKMDEWCETARDLYPSLFYTRVD